MVTVFGCLLVVVVSQKVDGAAEDEVYYSCPFHRVYWLFALVLGVELRWKLDAIEKRGEVPRRQCHFLIIP
jgi:hypothetical protein